MMDYIISADNMGDLPESYIQEKQISLMSLSYMIDGETYNQENSLPSGEFYDKMRRGSMPTTSQVNPEEARKILENMLEKSNHIIHIAFSSGLSGTYNSTRLAAQELMEERDCRITVIDSLCASLGEGLLIYYAVALREAGKSYDEVVEWLEGHKLNICHDFTVDDLFHLYRGGRVSKAAAVIGTMISLKPVLHVDNEGHLIPVSKVRGRKKSLLALVDNMEKKIGSWKEKNDIVFISHGDCIEDAEFVREQVEERFGIHRFIINPVGPTIGAHSGPGTVALFYLGDMR